MENVLLARAKNGDRDAFDRLSDPYRARLTLAAHQVFEQGDDETAEKMSLAGLQQARILKDPHHLIARSSTVLQSLGSARK